jgi:hypothetical protein
MASIADAGRDATAVEVDNRLSSAEARRQGIDDAVRRAFDHVCGEWKVTLTEIRHFSPPWWWVTMQGRHEVVEISLRSDEQHPDVVHDRLVDALRNRSLLE